jgi:hypothetical protein
MKNIMHIFKDGGWILLIFGLVFTAFALHSVTRVIPMVSGYVQTRNWQEIPANIDDLKLVYSKSDETNTYSITAAYSYRFEGVTYVNNRVGLVQNTDSFARYWRDLKKHLATEQRQGMATAWVNPDNPAEAVLDRSFRVHLFAFRMSFVCLFGLIGIGFLGCSQASWFPGYRGIRSQQLGTYIGGIIFGLILIMMGIFPYLFVSIKLTVGVILSMIVSLLITSAGGYIVREAWLERRKYRAIGPTVLKILSSPPKIGSLVDGEFMIRSAQMDGPIEMSLICTQTLQSGDHSVDSVLWNFTNTASVYDNGSGLTVGFSIDVPDHLPPNGRWASGGNITWELHAKGYVKTKNDRPQVLRSWYIPFVR